ncbi:MAG: hypothetical protein HRT35_31445 [Algicola sp.]|nr:hypothetical protein [Algicola sp.]
MSDTNCWHRPPWIDYFELNVEKQAADTCIVKDNQQGQKQLASLIRSGLGVWKEANKLCFESYQNIHDLAAIKQLICAPCALYQYLDFNQRYYPTTDMQAINLERLCARNGGRTMVAEIGLDFSLNVAVLQQALNQVVARHSVLRTTARQLLNSWIQIVHQDYNIQCETTQLINYQGCAPFSQRIRQFRAELDQQKVSVAGFPLLRVIHVTDENNNGSILVKASHFCFDGYSIALFISELLERCLCLISGKNYPVVDLKAQFAHFCLTRFDKSIEHNNAYWAKYMAQKQAVFEQFLFQDKPALVEGPLDALVEDLAQRSGNLLAKFSPSINAKIASFCQLKKVHHIKFIISAIVILIYRLTGQTVPLMMGVTLRNKKHQLNTVIGDFAVALPMVLDIKAGSCPADIFKSYNREITNIGKHMEHSCSQVRAKSLDDNKVMNPKLMISTMDFDLSAPRLSDKKDNNATFRNSKGKINHAFFNAEPLADLMIFVVKTEGESQFVFHHDKRKFSSQTMQLFFDNLSSLIEQFTDTEEVDIDHYLIDEALQKRLLK